jgi:mannose-6-phosphate isomerase-like protein (cupin superfamily)
VIGEDESDMGEIAPGDLVRIPPGTWHRVPCVGDEPLRYLVVDVLPGRAADRRADLGVARPGRVRGQRLGRSTT